MTHLPEEQFHVYLYDKRVGRLHRRGDTTRFVFEPDYWDDPNRAVLGLRFEENRNERHQNHLHLPRWFSNLLPEGRLRDWIAHARGATVGREMELLAQVGHDLPGAVRVLAADEAVPVDLSTDSATNSILDNASNPLWRFSLAGVGLKFSLFASGDRLVLPAYGEGGDWIVKLPDSAYPDLPWNELAMMKLAGAVGIEVPEMRLIHRDQVGTLPDPAWAGTQGWAYAVKRFDRGARRELIHIEDLAQVRGFWPDKKYEGSYETVAALVYRNHDSVALREFSRRLMFNILIGNGDAHLKNWSLIYHDQRIPTLAPAYDLVSTFDYCPPSKRPQDMALSLNRSRRFEDMRLTAFSRLDEKLKAQAGLEDVAREVVELVLKEWPQAAEVLANQPELASKIKDFIDQRAEQLLSCCRGLG